jgi:hypothetical protein
MSLLSGQTLKDKAAEIIPEHPVRSVLATNNFELTLEMISPT